MSQVEHLATVAARPDIACIWDRLLAISKWSKVQSIRNETRIGMNHIFNFEAKGAPHSIGILIDDDGSTTYRNTAWARNLTLPELQAAQRSLFEVDELLDGHCDLGPIVGNVRQTCFGKNCDRLAVLSD